MFSSEHIVTCSRYIPTKYNQIVLGFIIDFESKFSLYTIYPLDLNKLVLLFTYYYQLFQTIKCDIISQVISDVKRQNIFKDCLFILSHQSSKWDTEIFNCLGIYIYLVFELYLNCI